MILFASATRTRMAIDNRVNRDLVAQARQQGFVFANPPADGAVWEQVETADLENPAYDCSPVVSEWLFGKAVEAVLFQLYQEARRKKSQPLQA